MEHPVVGVAAVDAASFRSQPAEIDMQVNSVCRLGALRALHRGAPLSGSGLLYALAHPLQEARPQVLAALEEARVEREQESFGLEAKLTFLFLLALRLPSPVANQPVSLKDIGYCWQKRARRCPP